MADQPYVRGTSGLVVAITGGNEVAPGGGTIPTPWLDTVAAACSRAGRRLQELRVGAALTETGASRDCLVVTDTDLAVGPGALADGYRIHRALGRLDPAVIILPAGRGWSWAVLEARRQGLGYQGTTVVVVHEPTAVDAPTPAPVGTTFERALAAALDRVELSLADHLVGPDGVETLAEIVSVAARPGGTLTDGPALFPAEQAQPLVSAIITHYERPELARRAIDSLLDQSWQNLEIIVVDDGSASPQAEALLSELESRTFDRPLRVVRKANGGLGSARNAGVSAAAGEFVAFLDDDDEAEPTYIERLATALHNTGAAAATVGFRVFHDAGDGPLRGRAEQLHWLYFAPALHLAALDNTIGGAAAMFRKAELVAAGGYHTQAGLAYEDWHLLVKVALAGGSVIALPEALLCYRVSDSSMLRTFPLEASHALVLEPFAAALPAQLADWPTLLLALHRSERALASERDDAVSERDRLAAALSAAGTELVELRAVAAHRDALLRSVSWRLGQLIVAPFGFLRDLRRRRSGSATPAAGLR